MRGSDMTTMLQEVRWGWILVAGVAVHAVQIALATVISVVATTALTLVTQGPPDVTWLERLLSIASFWTTPVLTVLLTVVAGLWVAHQVRNGAALLHGVLVGVLVAAVGFSFQPLNFEAVALALMTIIAGWLGALWGANRRWS